MVHYAQKITLHSICFLFQDESSFEDLQKYVLKRLITGLSSNRQAASLGFATALCEVLKLLKSDLVLRELLITISEYLKTSKQDNRAVSYSIRTDDGLLKHLSVPYDVV